MLKLDFFLTIILKQCKIVQKNEQMLKNMFFLILTGDHPIELKKLDFNE